MGKFTNPKDRQDAASADDLDIDATVAAIEEAAQTTAAPTLMTMDQVIALIGATKNAGGLSKDDLRELVEGLAKSNAQAVQTSINRENPNYVGKGPFYDEQGRETKPNIDVFFGPQGSKGKGGRLPFDMFSIAERDLVNRFEPGMHLSARDGKWTADVVKNGSTVELIVKVPMTTMDQRSDLPAFSMILMELLDGKQAADPAALADRVAELERKLKAAGVAA